MLAPDSGWEAFVEANPQALALFAVDDRGRLSFAIAGRKFEPGPRATVYVLNRPPTEQA